MSLVKATCLRSAFLFALNSTERKKCKKRGYRVRKAKATVAWKLHRWYIDKPTTQELIVVKAN